MTITMLERMPSPFFISQGWKANATEGVSPDPNGTLVQQLVAAHGNYQRFGHDGIDIGCPAWSEIVAPGPGVVDYAGWSQSMPQWVADKYGFIAGNDTGGMVVLIDHGGGLATALLHNNQVGVSSGQRVFGGQRVAYSGSTGRSGGPHCHFSAIDLATVYTTPMYGRINPLSRIPAGLIIPIAPGNTGGAADITDYLVDIEGIEI